MFGELAVLSDVLPWRRCFRLFFFFPGLGGLRAVRWNSFGLTAAQMAISDTAGNTGLFFGIRAVSPNHCNDAGGLVRGI